MVSHAYFRAEWPKSQPVAWRQTPGLANAVLKQENNGTELLIDMTDAKSPVLPIGAPLRFQDPGHVEISSFRDWAEVSGLMAPLYAKAAQLPPGSPLDAEIKRIKAANKDQKSQVEAALTLVQEQIRYLFLAQDLGGYVPADADITWSRRFGDCKGKTALLLALLHGLGVEAQPIMVSTTGGDGMDGRLPMLASFDHVLVRAVIAGRVYWLDGTRQGDRHLEQIQTPNFRWGLPVQAAGAVLTRLEPPPLDHPEFSSILHIDARSGLDKPAPAHAENVYVGDAGFALNQTMALLNPADRERSLKNFWRNERNWIEPETVNAIWDADRGRLVLTMDGKATVDWRRDGGARFFDMDDSSLGWTDSSKREGSLYQDAPYVVSYPLFRTRRVEVDLPGGGAGFGLAGGSNIDKTVAGIAFKRVSSLAGGKVVMEASERSMEQEFPADHAEADFKALHDMAYTDVMIAAGAAYEMTLPASLEELSGATAARDPMSAGKVLLAKGDLTGAIQNFDQAVKLAPNNASYIYNRGVAYFEAGQDDLALADFNKAIALQPDNSLALLGRGAVLLAKNDDVRAKADFDAYLRQKKGDIKALLQVSQTYDQAARFESESRLYDDAITRSATPTEKSSLLNDRCWARAEWGQELDKALDDCTQALTLNPANVAALDSRGLVNLRLHRLSAAMADYQAALNAGPKSSATYGRGLVEQAMGQQSDAARDMAVAKRLDPDVAARFASFGVKP